MRKLLAALLFVLAACGSDPAGPITPPPTNTSFTVTISPAAATIIVEDTIWLSARVRNDTTGVITKETLSWKSLNRSIIILDQDMETEAAIVTGAGIGTAQVTATFKSFVDTARITVNPHVYSVSVQPSFVDIYIDETDTLTATVKQDGTSINVPVVWLSLNTNIVTIDNAGSGSDPDQAIVTPVDTGTTSITATYSGVTDTVAVTVKPHTYTVSVTPAGSSFFIGDTITLTATVVRDGNDTLNVTVDWKSSDPAVASVDSAGLVTGLEVGTVDITATYMGAVGTAVVDVKVPPFKIYFHNEAIDNSKEWLWKMDSDGGNYELVRPSYRKHGIQPDIRSDGKVMVYATNTGLRGIPRLAGRASPADFGGGFGWEGRGNCPVGHSADCLRRGAEVGRPLPRRRVRYPRSGPVVKRTGPGTARVGHVAPLDDAVLLVVHYGILNAVGVAHPGSSPSVS